jgi:hypothetical protein
MNGNVTQEGITADLEWMKRAGLAGMLDDVRGAKRRLLDTGPHFALLGFLKPLVVALATARERWRDLLIDHAACEKKAASSALSTLAPPG